MVGAPGALIQNRRINWTLLVGRTSSNPPGGRGRVNALQKADDGGGALPPSRRRTPTLEKEDAGDRAHPGGPVREPDRNQGQFSTELCSVVKVKLFNHFSQTYLTFVSLKLSGCKKDLGLNLFSVVACFFSLRLHRFYPGSRRDLG